MTSKVRRAPKARQPYITQVGQKKAEEVVEVKEEKKPDPKLFEGKREFLMHATMMTMLMIGVTTLLIDVTTLMIGVTTFD